MEKQVLDGYVGVKFRACALGCATPVDLGAYYPAFRAAGDRLRTYGMTPLNGGNMSVRVAGDGAGGGPGTSGPGGFVVTASGAHLGDLDPEDLVYVERCDVAAETVCYTGDRPPSSEAILHHLVLAARPGDGAVIHAHDPAATRAALDAAGLLAETDREEPYGTMALARRAIETFGADERIILLRDHGYVCVGPDLATIVTEIVAVHDRLVAAMASPG